MTYLTHWARQLSAGFFLVAAAVATVPDAASAGTVDSKKFGAWTYEHFIGDIEWCGVSTNWPDQAMVLTIRLRRDALDFFFFNEDWNLTRGRRMGDTVFIFGSRRFGAATETLDSNKAIFGTFSDRISDFVTRFMRARTMRIDFPTDQTIEVSLKGSSRAMNTALLCWERHLEN
ncbi:MAG: hypothetical protein ACE5EU_00150 [Paracoccaceae bacterium]